MVLRRMDGWGWDEGLSCFGCGLVLLRVVYCLAVQCSVLRVVCCLMLWKSLTVRMVTSYFCYGLWGIFEG